MGRFVIVAYQAKAGQREKLRQLIKRHLELLRSEQLVTDKQARVMQAADGTIIEVFEWRSAEAIARAHESPSVNALWDEFAQACDFVPLNTLPETREMFAEFDAIEP